MDFLTERLKFILSLALPTSTELELVNKYGVINWLIILTAKIVLVSAFMWVIWIKIKNIDIKVSFKEKSRNK